ncbi:bifunctional methylenetetrahydrofolate dehydrogenase/methenyltetrahydrofolate cyclohydrolase FolD [Myxococcota bacterium]|nr:bifunctional methylenetetrahydrofolate dehydrogenase/methenyltetrahydrofolate cyclohydrolase FolD [Myxococcota bacterium]
MILEGKSIAAEVRRDVAAGVAEFRALAGRPPGLAVVLVGADPASSVYVANKERSCDKVGIRSFPHHLPASTTEPELLALVDRLNRDAEVDGILVQLPLPSGMAKNRVLSAIDPAKDVDGFHPLNVGLLALRRPRFVPCTPLGILEILRRAGVDVAGRRAVIVGRSRTVGLPMSMLLNAADCTVTVTHRHTTDLAGEVGRADLLVVAVGRPGLIRGDWIRPGAVVVDVGINRVDGALVGDVEFEGARARASAITPVPGGVGPMTVAMLLLNTLRAARLAAGHETYTGAKTLGYGPLPG